MGLVKKHKPLRNEVGRFIKPFIENSPKSSTAMKTNLSTKMKGKKFKKQSIEAPRIGKKTSVVWNFFKALPHENGISRAVCLLCKVVFKNPGGSTTGMRGHLERKHPGVVEGVLETEKIKIETGRHRASLPVTKTEQKAYIRSVTPPPPHLSIENGAIGEVGETEIFEQDSQSILIDIENDRQKPSTSKEKKHILPGPPPQVYSATNTDETTKSIVMYLASAMLPIHHVEDPHFKKLLYTLNSAYTVEATSIDSDSIYSSVVDTLDDLYKEVKEDIQRKLQDKRFSISLELWAKTNSEIFVLVSAHYITREWNLENCFLGMRHLADTCIITHPDTVAEKVSQVVGVLLEEYELKSENAVHVLVNSIPCSVTSNILTITTWPCINEIAQRSYELLNEFLVPVTNCDLLHNTLKIGKQVLLNYKDVKNHPGKVTESLKDFLTTHSTDSLPVKVEDLDECIKLQEPINMIVETLLEQPLLTSSSILPIIFFIRTAYIDQINSSTSNWSKEQRQETTNAISNQIETSYKIDLNARDLGSDPMLAVCAFLDPRYKKLVYLTEEQQEYVYDTVIELLYELQREKGREPTSDTGSIISVRSENPAYSDVRGNVINSTTDPLNPSSSAQSSSDSYPSTKLSKLLCSVVGKRPIKTPSVRTLDELTKYYAEPVAVLTMDPYQWWSSNCDRFPNVAELAKRYLCIRGNSSFARLNFTGAGRNFRHCLNLIEPEFVDKLQVLRRYHSLHIPQLDGADASAPQIAISNQYGIKNETVEEVELMEEEV